jgi:hypothetical protein
MKRFEISAIIIALASVGCSSTSINEATVKDDGGGAAGAAGSSAGSAGQTSTGGSGGTAGTSTGGSAGTGTGGAAGNPADGGAGQSGTGGTGGTAGSNTGGTGGGTCVPKTCATLSYQMTDGGAADLACGLIPNDGCGNVIDCGSCSNPTFKCGKTTPNLCGDTCWKAPQKGTGLCSVTFPSLYETTCQSSSTPPYTGCKNPSGNDGGLTDTWCCP